MTTVCGSLGIDTKITLLAAGVVVFFFVAAIAAYIDHGARRDTVNQFENADGRLRLAMVLLIIGEIGGFTVLLAGFVAGQLV
jgi:hypothetical protein